MRTHAALFAAAERLPAIRDDLRRWFRFVGAVLVVDLSGWSALCERLAAIDAVLTAERTHQAIATLSGAHGGQVVKTSGDNLFAVFGEARAAVACGVEIARRIGIDDGLMTPCLGIAVGEMIVIAGEDLWGAAVNRASRLAEDTAGPGELLVDQPVLDAVGADRWKSEAIEYRLAGRPMLARKILL